MLNLFIYQWIVEDENDELLIRGFGLDEENNDVCIHVKNFKPWISLELLSSELSKADMKRIVSRNIDPQHFVLGDFTLKSKLYFDHGNQKFKVFPLHFHSIKMRKMGYYKLQNQKRLPFKVHEHEATPLLQFLCRYNLPSCGWINITKIMNTLKHTFTRYSKEYSIDCKNIEPSSEPEKLGVPIMSSLSFDLETYSSDETRHPDYHNKKDVIFQIGVSECSKDVKEKNIIFTLSSKPFCLKSSEVLVFETEKQLLQAFCNHVKEFNPHIMMGYNIFGFDIPYLYHRCKMNGVFVESIGMSKDDKRIAEYKEIKWSSSAYSVQEFHYLDLEGRIMVDLLPIVKRDYKLNNYKLKTVSTFFLGETKDPMTVKDIFEAYRLGFLGGKTKKVLICAKYCVQDARLVLLLFQKIQCWIGLIEMARICNVGIMTLYTQGQQIKVFSQVYKKCFEENRMVDSFNSLDIPSNISFHFDNYCGAFVFPPIPGKYKWVIPFDFTSLYPTTIIAYNIDYSTLVSDETVPDDLCHIVKWKEGENEYKFRFKKEPIGVIPSLLQSLLQQRNSTKKLLKATRDDVLKTVLDKRQLAYKVSANSMYGAMGVQRGYLPFLPGAMCTTAKGRESIQKAAEFVQKEHFGKIIYGDSVEKNTTIYVKVNNDIRLYSIEEYFRMNSKYTQPYPQFKPDDPTLKMKEQIVFRQYTNDNIVITDPNYFQNRLNNNGIVMKEQIQLNRNNIKVMTHQGWAPICRLIRHKTEKKMFKVYTTSGSVVITEDHSLLLKNGKCISPKRLVPLEHELLNINNPHLLSYEILYQKEKWNGIYFQNGGKIFFDKNIEEKYVGYIYYTYLKYYPNCVFGIQDGDLYLDLHNKNKITRGLVLKVEFLEQTNDYVYDIETTEGSFHCGNGSLIVKNTDSIYCHFPKYEDPSVVWNKAKDTEQEFLSLFPPPMKLLFEEKIYRDFLILTKKRYMAYTCDETGTIDEKMTIRGVLLARRDNCAWTRMFYEQIVRMIMENKDENYDDVFNYFNENVLKLFQWAPELNDIGLFIITKALNADYKIREINSDVKKAQKRFDELDVKTPNELNIERINKDIKKGESEIDYVQEYIDKCKPAHVQLATRMEKRGLPISVGSRMEYVILEHNEDPDARLGQKLEDPTYFNMHCDILRLDRLYYLKSIVPSMDQLFETVAKDKTRKANFVKKIYDHHLKHFKVMKQWKQMNSTKINYLK
jgi:DNA polymerase elongation subunit (family B)